MHHVRYSGISGVVVLLGMTSLGSAVAQNTTVSANNTPAPDLRTRKIGSDWPTFLGPQQNSVSPEVGIRTPWPKEGLKIVWEAPLGLGYAPPVVAKGRLFHFDAFGPLATLTCRHAETGKLLWKFEYPIQYEDLYGYDAGPRACPVVDGDRVYIHGVEGMLHCLRVTDGKLLWKVDTQAKYHFHQNFFGVGSVPVVHGDLLIVPIGGSPKGPRPIDLRQAKGNGTGIVAFNKFDGTEKYRLSDELASYSSPIVTTIQDRKWGLYFARGGLVGFDPEKGKVDFHFPWRAKIEQSVNAANPVVVGDQVLLSECYGPGATLLRIKGNQCETLWSDADSERQDKRLQCHWNTPIHVNGYVYGCSGRHTEQAEIRCLEWATGKVMWRKKGFSRSSLLYVDGHFVALTEDGILLLFKPNPEKYEEVSRWVIDDLAYPCWAAPVLSHGLLYLRGKGRLLCVELIPQR